MSPKRPEYHLKRVFEDGAAEAPEILPVTEMPWDARMDRRGAVGVGLTTAGLLWLVPSAGAELARRHSQQQADPTRAPAPTGNAHVARVNALCFASDGPTLASASGDNTVKLWSQGAWKATLAGHSADVNCLALSADTQWLASGSSDGTVRLWSLPEGRPGLVLQGPGGEISSLAAGPALLAAGCENGTVRLWTMPEGRLVGTIEAHTSRVGALAMSSDGALLASSTGQRSVSIRSLPDGREQRVIELASRLVDGLAFSPDRGALLYVATADVVQVYSSGEGLLRATIAGHHAAVDAIAVAPSGGAVASGTRDREVRISFPEGDRPAKSLRANATVTALAFAPDGRSLVSGDQEGVIALWQIEPARFTGFLADPVLGGGRPAGSDLRAHTGPITGLSVTRDGLRIVTAGADNKARIWSLPDGQLVCRIAEQSAPNAALSLDDGGTIALAVADGIHLWSVPRPAGSSPAPPPPGGKAPRRPAKPPPPAAGTLAKKLEMSAENVRDLSLTPDGKMLISGGDDHLVRLWSLPDAAPIGRLEGHRNPVRDLVVSDDGSFLVSSSISDGEVRVWSLRDRRLLTIIGRGTSRSALVVSDGRTVVSTSAGRISLWRLPEGAPWAEFEGRFQTVSCLALSPDGSLLASGSREGAVSIWSVAEKRLLAVLEGHKQSLTGLAFVLDGRSLVSSATDGGLRLWSLEPPHLQADLAGHSFGLSHLAVAPGGRWLVSGDMQGVAILWDLEKRALHTYLFDPTATSSTAKGLSYDVYDQITGRYITYTLPCGSPIPPGAVCTCNCVPGSVPAPSYSPGRSSGGFFCSCNKICTCVPVPSSRRWKTDIRPLEGALDRIARLRGVGFNWSDAAPDGLAGADIGLIAEEVANVVPEAVAYDERGQPCGVDYRRLTALLVEAVKSQQAQIAELQSLICNFHLPHDAAWTATCPSQDKTSDLGPHEHFRFVVEDPGPDSSAP